MRAGVWDCNRDDRFSFCKDHTIYVVLRRRDNGRIRLKESFQPIKFVRTRPNLCEAQKACADGGIKCSFLYQNMEK